MELLSGSGELQSSDMESVVGSPSTFPDDDTARKRAASQGVDDLRASEEQPEPVPTSPSSQGMYPPLFAGHAEVMPTDWWDGGCDRA